MPYIPPANRPPIDAAVDVLAEQIADALAAGKQTAEMSVHYRNALLEIAESIAAAESGNSRPATSAAGKLAATILAVAAGYGQLGAWAGEFNYAVTILIQAVPYKMYKRGIWAEPLRYWIHAQTVGALTRAAYDVHAKMGNDYIGNGLAGVLEDIKDELKRRVNTAYEAAQILKSGDCFERMPYQTQLTPFESGGVKGYIEIMLPHRTPA